MGEGLSPRAWGRSGTGLQQAHLYGVVAVPPALVERQAAGADSTCHCTTVGARAADRGPRDESGGPCSGVWAVSSSHHHGVEKLQERPAELESVPFTGKLAHPAGMRVGCELGQVALGTCSGEGLVAKVGVGQAPLLPSCWCVGDSRNVFSTCSSKHGKHGNRCSGSLNQALSPRTLLGSHHD